MAPEYAVRGQFSVKSDVFSFGVLLLEIVSGRRNSWFQNEDVEDLLSCAWGNWNEGTAFNFIDPTLRNDSRTNQMMTCIHIGLLCVQENVAYRPTMALTIRIFSLSTLPKITVSSANCNKETVSPLLPISIPCSSPSDSAFLTNPFSPSIIIRNRNGDKGSPCLNPLSKSNSSVGLPFTNIEHRAVERHSLIHPLHLAPKPNLSIIQSRYVQLTQS
ncbi:hypothetical protein SLEP1_g47646 [Rubroshorea leprosula]|uniref:Serine-threonine/tyrosine-protein kinase catalytic domain-containing protein n=1 Tax=Rubroshorea leprosula TaxID=152421 RepID=A0AAV5LSX3_9ROSI|nr:hypothetical protein SLEP1_g47646 [Rubroshorea leprosula]